MSRWREITEFLPRAVRRDSAWTVIILGGQQRSVRSGARKAEQVTVGITAVAFHS